jgi:hypothetical protein
MENMIAVDVFHIAAGMRKQENHGTVCLCGKSEVG